MPDNTTTYPTRESWLEARKGWLGASDVPSMLGESVIGEKTYMSPMELWGIKTGLLPPRERSEDEKEAMDMGTRLERTIGEIYAEQAPADVRFPAPYTVWHCGDAPLAATLDATIDHSVAPHLRRVLQIKNVREYLAKDWADGPPWKYRCQTLAEMLCSGMRSRPAVLAAMIGGNRVRAFDVEYHEEFAEELKRAARDFWHLVETKTPPEVDASESCRRVLQRLHPGGDGTEVELPPEAIKWAEQRLRAKAVAKAAEEQSELAGNQLRAAIGSATSGVLPDGRVITLRTQTTKAHMRKESTTRVLRIPKQEV